MTRIILPSEHEKIPEKDLFKVGKPVVGIRAVAPVNGKEQVRAVVYKRKAFYGDLSENHV